MGQCRGPWVLAEARRGKAASPATRRRRLPTVLAGVWHGTASADCDETTGTVWVEGIVGSADLSRPSPSSFVGSSKLCVAQQKLAAMPLRRQAYMRQQRKLHRGRWVSKKLRWCCISEVKERDDGGGRNMNVRGTCIPKPKSLMISRLCSLSITVLAVLVPGN